MDTETYNKAQKYRPGRGYEARVNPPTSIIVHSTSSLVKNTLFANEAKFLYESSLVSAHYLIGKDGAIVRFLDPRKWAAWHAGNTIPAFLNQRSIGVELHHSVGDPPYPDAQLNALSALLRSLWGLFNIPIERIETHGQVALPGPYKRKTDPSDMTYAEFRAFRADLAPDPPSPPAPTPPPPAPVPYTVRGLPVYQRADHTGALWGHLVTGEFVAIDNATNGHLADGRGFVDLAGLEAI
jgi:N-acetylmuramoyl-L-alanine amidase-like protein